MIYIQEISKQKSTVKPVLKGHHWDKEKVVFSDR